MQHCVIEILYAIYIVQILLGENLSEFGETNVSCPAKFQTSIVIYVVTSRIP